MLRNSSSAFIQLFWAGIITGTKEMPLKDIKESPLDTQHFSQAALHRLAFKIQKGKEHPFLLWNKTTGHLLGEKVVLHAFRELHYKTAPVIVLKISREQEIALYKAFPN